MPNLKDLTIAEDQIDLNNHSVEVLDANRMVQNFSSFVKLNNQPVNAQQNKLDLIGLTPAGITAFKTLYDAAIALKTTERNYITGVKFCYAANVNLDQLTLIYQPVLFYQTGVSDAGNNVYTYDMIEGKQYIYNGTDFTANLSQNDKDGPERYYQKVTIKHYSTAQTLFTPFNRVDDTTCAFFSFQEIFDLLDDNPNRKIWIYSAILDVMHDMPEVRHTVLLSPEIAVPLEITHQIQLEYFSYDFTGKFADLAHLCPPNCKVKFRLE